jgi:hypothetical protein
MKNEIDKTNYCAGNYFQSGCCTDRHEGPLNKKPCKHAGCKLCRLKWPTPEQYKKEYGEEWPDDWAVYFRCEQLGRTNETEWGSWYCEPFYQFKASIKHRPNTQHVCACTTWGKPPDDFVSEGKVG